MGQKGQLMGVPIKLVMALVIGVMIMGILTQFVGTAERTVLRDMNVVFNISGNHLAVEAYDAQSGDSLGGVTIVVKYPGGMKAHTCSMDSNRYTFDVPIEADYAIVTVRVTHNGYIPWEGEAALSA